jgi:hypothetical protein
MPEEALSGGSENVSEASSSPSESQEPSSGFGEATQGEPRNGSETAAEASSASLQNKDGKSEAKPKSRYQRTLEWRKSVEDREKKVAEAERRITEFEQRQQRVQEPSYTLEQLKQYRAGWAKEAEYDEEKASLVQQADAEIARLEGRHNHEQQWLNAEATIRKEDPDFGISGTPIDRKLREILDGPQGSEYRRYPLGIVAAYDLAKRLLMEEENKELRTKYSRTEEENKRLNGLTSIGSGAPGQMSGGGGGEMSSESFRKLSLDQMRARLRRDAVNSVRR